MRSPLKTGISLRAYLFNISMCDSIGTLFSTKTMSTATGNQVMEVGGGAG